MNGERNHIVDILIAERAPRLAAAPIWPLLRPMLYNLLDYRKAVALADRIAGLPGVAALEAVSDLLKVEVEVAGLEHVPREGACVLVSNHPTGIADGVAAWDALRPARPDLAFYANSDAHRVAPGFGDVLIPVEWVEAKRTRERTRQTLVMTQAAFAAGRALFIFPAGRLARAERGGLVDPEWMPSAVTLARKNGAPVVPVRMSGPWSFWFHLFDRMSEELRDMTLFKELLNKQGRRFRLDIGPPIPPARLEGDPVAVTNALKAHVEQVMARDPNAAFGGIAA